MSNAASLAICLQGSKSQWASYKADVGNDSVDELLAEHWSLWKGDNSFDYTYKYTIINILLVLFFFKWHFPPMRTNIQFHHLYPWKILLTAIMLALWYSKIRFKCLIWCQLECYSGLETQTNDQSHIYLMFSSMKPFLLAAQWEGDSVQ